MKSPLRESQTHLGILDPVKGDTHGSQSSQIPTFRNKEVLCVSVLTSIGVDLIQSQLQSLGEIIKNFNFN